MSQTRQHDNLGTLAQHVPINALHTHRMPAVWSYYQSNITT